MAKTNKKKTNTKKGKASSKSKKKANTKKNNKKAKKSFLSFKLMFFILLFTIISYFIFYNKIDGITPYNKAITILKKFSTTEKTNKKTLDQIGKKKVKKRNIRKRNTKKRIVTKKRVTKTKNKIIPKVKEIIEEDKIVKKSVRPIKVPTTTDKNNLNNLLENKIK